MSQSKTTPLYEVHKSLGAKMIPFGGWDMPVQYSGIIAEHTATREAAGLFDVSHMGEIFLEGDPKVVLDFLESVTCNSVASLSDGQVQYNAIINQSGGLVDDITLYRFNDQKYMICANASNVDAVYGYLKPLVPKSGVKLENQSANWHQIAIQGPKADEILSSYLKADLSKIGYYKFILFPFNGEDLILSRTGYTGEDGFEIYSSNATGIKLWKELLEHGKEKGLVPVGLGARDTLRIEAKYPLYGHELDEGRSPVQSGIGWIVKEKTIPYPNYENIIQEKKEGPSQRIVGFELQEAGVPRENMPVLDSQGKKIGITTSGTFSPSLKKGIGLALIDCDKINHGESIQIEIRGQAKPAIVFTKSFIPGSIRKN
ncbi:glycine cleavage system aminomethyltransferase GcvT [Leptospira langatensis]|uniref:Aminomethyltransferase n=1 Tax=Leptospira langatensis TaxID=2484983 RepID=A0A5F1ZVS1_9LEPT|nr:glycine cleavage system aminomethyltransferase GcvT [Leptospira langatensis]TGK02910.1 glycine cleavage system aminomethyltransferase GcvT [Leptospira langatensis]TGL41665.1 glycine cleavage system aminomethyltransferase GcvT [Leptospira langatensis]